VSERSVPVTSTGLTGLRYYLRGWYFTNTDATNAATITIRLKDAAGPIVWQITLNKGASVGEDLASPIDLRTVSSTAPDVHVTITGGTVQGAVRGR
jgi:hypothetical protein